MLGASEGASVSTSDAGVSESANAGPTTAQDETGAAASGVADESGSGELTGETGSGPELPGCTSEATELLELVNAYRVQRGLPAVPHSPSMCAVGQAHAEDLELHEPHNASIDCNMHSWSDQGEWTPCCYTPDHAQAECMWNKPMEIAGYPGVGFENAAGSTGELSPREALEVWQWSSDHDALILNEGPWAEFEWKAMGAGLSGGYGVLWVGTEPDPAR